MIFLSRCSVLDSYGSSDCSAVKSVPLRGSVWLQHGGAGSRGFAALRAESLWLSAGIGFSFEAMPRRQSREQLYAIVLSHTPSLSHTPLPTPQHCG
ncbi:MAG TPA: hypothetical protein VIK24_06110, partial [Pyrinomonadaceae bacterium]